MAVFRNCVEVAVSGLASQHQWYRVLDTGRAGESDVARAQQPTLVAGRAPTGLCRGQDQPRGIILHAPKGQCLLGVCLTL